MDLIYWDDQPGLPKNLRVKGLMPEADKSFPHPSDLRAWLKKSNWKKGPEHRNSMTIAIGNWKGQQAQALFGCCDGTITAEAVAEHILGGMSNWSVMLNWFAAYLQTIKNEGYNLGYHLADSEFLRCSTGEKYLSSDGETVTMYDVLEILYGDGKPDYRLPDIDYDTIKQGTPYRDVKHKRAHLQWNHWAQEQTDRAHRRVWHNTAKQLYPEIITTNYESSRYHSDPICDLNSGMPRCNSAVDGNGPVLYLHKDYKIYSNMQAMELLKKCDRLDRTIPWVGAGKREGVKDKHGNLVWYQRQDNPGTHTGNLLADIKAAGCPSVGVF